MKVWQRLHNMIVAALVPMILCAGMAFGQTAKLDDLFNKLKAADPQAAERIEHEIWIEWSKSGSAAMDLLLERGRRAMSAGQLDLAVEHFTALVDHAPDFAEGWNARATAVRPLNGRHRPDAAAEPASFWCHVRLCDDP